MELTKLANLKTENVAFNPSKDYTIKNSKIKYQRIKIETNYPNSKKGALRHHFYFLLESMNVLAMRQIN